MSDQNTFTLNNIPHEIIKGKSLDCYEKIILLYLATFKKGSCFPSLDRIASDLQISRDKVRKGINKLKTLSYLAVYRDEKRKSNHYLTNMTPCQDAKKPCDEKLTLCQVVTKPVTRLSGSLQPGFQEASNLNPKIIKNNLNAEKAGEALPFLDREGHQEKDKDYWERKLQEFAGFKPRIISQLVSQRDQSLDDKI